MPKENKMLFKQMLTMQDHLNSVTIEDWQQQNLPWKTAIITETAEALEEMKASWCWWKESKNNVENYSNELVDVFHFLLSLGLQDFTIPTLTKEIEENLFTKFSSSSLQEDSTYFIQKVCLYTPTLPNYISLLEVFFVLLNYSNVTSIENLFKRYTTKNALNIIRQNNENYKRDWNGVPDSKAVATIASTIPITEDFYDIIKLTLQKYYSLKVK